MADHIDLDSFARDMDLFRSLSEALIAKETMACQLLGCGNEKAVPTLSVIFEALDILTIMLRKDFEAIFHDIHLPFHLYTSQIDLTKQSYEQFRNRFLQLVSYTLRYSSIHNMSFHDALRENHYDVNLSLQQFYHAFHLYVDMVTTQEQMTSIGSLNVYLPLSLYRNATERQRCFDRINHSLDNINKLNNKTLLVNGSSDTAFGYEDILQITEVEDICFGDYFAHAQQAVGEMRARNISQYSDKFKNMAKSFNISVRTLTAPVIQLRRDIEEFLSRYTQKTISKFQVCTVELYFLYFVVSICDFYRDDITYGGHYYQYILLVCILLTMYEY